MRTTVLTSATLTVDGRFDYVRARLGIGPADEIRLAQLAELVSLSPYHFARAFRQSFGVPPHRYHVGRRIERAKTLLASSTVTQVALAVGFAETSSFSAVFRRLTGFTPSEFRRVVM